MWAGVVQKWEKKRLLSHTFFCFDKTIFTVFILVDAKVLETELVVAVRLDDVVRRLVQAVARQEGRLEVALDSG